MGKKTPQEEQREAFEQRKLGERGISTGSAANTSGLRDYQAKQAKERRDKANDDAFIKTARAGAGTGGCSILLIAGIAVLMLGFAGIGLSLRLFS